VHATAKIYLLKRSAIFSSVPESWLKSINRLLFVG